MSKSVIDNLLLYKIYSRESCYEFISQNLSQFQRNAFLMLLYSTVLSRTIKKIYNDMDEPDGSLIGMHGYCTQVS